METPKSNLQPKDQKIDKRTIVLGVAGFLCLSVVLFVLGMYCIGPMMRDRMEERASSNSAPLLPPPPVAPPASEEEEPGLDVEVTEHTGEAASQEERPGSSGVTQDGNTITVDMNAEDHDGPDASVEEVPPTPPRPANTTVIIERPGAEPEKVTVPTEVPSEPVKNTSKPPASGGKGRYKVQAGTFASEANAQKVADDLRKKGYSPRIVTSEDGDRTLHRVQLGNYRTIEDARELSKDLNAQGFTSSVVTP